MIGNANSPTPPRSPPLGARLLPRVGGRPPRQVKSDRSALAGGLGEPLRSVTLAGRPGGLGHWQRPWIERREQVVAFGAVDLAQEFGGQGIRRAVIDDLSRPQRDGARA